MCILLVRIQRLVKMRFIAMIANNSKYACEAWTATPMYTTDGYVWYVPTDPDKRLVYEACVGPCITDIIHDCTDNDGETLKWAMVVSPNALPFSRVYR